MKWKHFIDKKTILMFAMIGMLGISISITSIRIAETAVEACQNVLDDATAQLAKDINTYVLSDRQMLLTIADMIMNESGNEKENIDNYVKIFQPQKTISQIAVLWKDGSVLCNDPYYESALSQISYEEEWKVPYMSSLQKSEKEGARQYLYQSVPLKKEGEVKGILFGLIDVENLSDVFTVSAFGDAASVYIIDAENGDFLVDTWHDTLGNIYEQEFDNRKVKAGYDFEKMKEDVKNGKEGHIAFFSETLQGYIYSCYKPVGINQWVAQISVPEETVFHDWNQIRYIIYGMTVTEGLLFLIYMIWKMLERKKAILKKEQELSQTLCTLDIQQLLFEAYLNKNNIHRALEKLADMMKSKQAFVVSLSMEKVKEIYTWPMDVWNREDLTSGVHIEDIIPSIVKKIQEEGSFILNEGAYSTANLEKKDVQRLENVKIKSLIVVPISNANGHVRGILGVANMSEKQASTELLENSARSFMMALSNVESYQLVQKMGKTDALTELLNRNSYQEFLIESNTMPMESLGCIYIDANGLHELNNHLGHEAGDKMLHSIGKALQHIFGVECSYRIGGDEFVVFCKDISELFMKNGITQLRKRMEQEEYDISIGYDWRKMPYDIDKLVAEAERKMYVEKRWYYQQKGNEEKAREMNRKLERILQAKKDVDTFLAIISPYFMGAYVVNLDTDDTRNIYEPSYFTVILEENDYKFKPSLSKYIEIFVQAAYQQQLYDLLDYEFIDRTLKTESSIEYRYEKKNGSRILLRICRAEETEKEKREVFWIFEKYKGKI